MALILDLSIPSNWLPIWSARLSEGVVMSLQKRIPDQKIPVLFDRRIIAVEATCNAGSPGWKQGGWFRPRLITGNSGMNKLKISDHRIILGERNLFILEDLGQYEGLISVPKHLPSFEVDVWQYIGIEVDTYESSKGRSRLVSSYTPSPVPVQILQRNDLRVGASMYNSSSVPISIGFSQNISFDNPVEVLYPGGQWVPDGSDIGEVWAVASSFSPSSLQVVEYLSK
jgi:hypothetical protein